MSNVEPDTGTVTPAAPELTADAPATPDTGVDPTAEIEKWKALAKKHEQRAKENASAAQELEKVRLAAMTDQEKAVAEAVAAARVDTLRSVGARLVDAEVRAVLAGTGIDPEALLEGLDRSRFLDDDGEPLRDEIVKWVNRLAPQPEVPGSAPFPDLGQGARGGKGVAPTGLGHDDDLTRGIKQALGIR